MKLNFKRLMAMFLSVMMLISMLPTMVFAAETDETQPESTNVAKIGETSYATLADAVAVATAGDTVTVTADVSGEAVTVDKNLTITGSATLTDVSITGSNGIELTVSGLTFAGNSWINANNAAALTVSGVTANVAPVNGTVINSRSAFIGLGASEQVTLELVVENCEILVPGSTDGVLGWAQITKATITGNTFGSEESPIQRGTNGIADAAKFMSIAAGATITATGNTVYSNSNGFAFYQNTTRDNAYTVVVEDNDFYGTGDMIWVEMGSGVTTTHATIKATSDNTVNGKTFTAADIKATSRITTWTSYAGVDVTTDENGKVTGGTLAFCAEDAIAEGYAIVENEDGTYGVATTVYKVATKAELDAAIAAAKDGDTIKLTADIDYAGTASLEINKAITLDLGGYTLTTHGTFGGLALKNTGCSVTNGKLNHAGTVAAIKVWDAKEISDLEIDVTGTSASGNTIDGIVIQENAAGVDLIEDVSIDSTSGQGVSSGIKTYNCGNATEDVIGAMNNVTIDAKDVGMNIYAPCGTATNCSIKGGVSGIEIWIKGTYSASLDLVDCDVTGGTQAVYAHDEFNDAEGVVNDGTITLTADEATTFTAGDDGVLLTKTIARINDEQITLPAAIDKKPVAQIGTTGYETLADAVEAANETEGGAMVTLLADVTLGEKLTITGNVTISGEHTITRDDAYTGTLFAVNAGATLTLDGGLVIDGANEWTFKEGKPALKAGGDTFLTDQVDCEDDAPNATGYMIENFGTLNVNKVTIQNNYSTNECGVIKARTNSVTTLNGATIQHIACNNTGAVVQIGRNNVTSNNATLTIKGDTWITNNIGASNGGIIMMHSQGNTFNLEGGSIDNNYIVASGTVFMSYCGSSSNKNTVNMSGGIITKNQAEGYGPVYIHTYTDFTMSGGEISENVSYYPTYVRGNNTAAITGGKIVNNTLSSTYSYTQFATASPTTITGGTFTQDVTKWLAPDTGLVYDAEAGVYTVTDDVAEINGTAYASIAEAVVAANVGDTVKVLAGHKPSATIEINKNITLDLNGKTIYGYGAVNPIIRVLADVTVTGNGMIDSANQGEGYCFIVGASDGSAGNLTIENGTFKGTTTAVSVTKGTATLLDGDFRVKPYKEVTGTDADGKEITTDNYNFLLNCIDANYKDGSAKIVVKGGTFTKFNPADNAAEGANTNFVAEGYVAVGNDDGTWTVQKGIELASVIMGSGSTKFFSSKLYTVEDVQDCINDMVGYGNIYSDAGSTMYPNIDVTLLENIITDLSIPAFRGGNVTIYNCSKLTGTVTVAEGYMLVVDETNDTATVKKVVYVAQIGETKYETLAEAITAANGTEITLLENTAEVIKIADNATVVINLNDKALTGSILAPNANLTVKNGSIVNTDKSVSALEINAGTLTLTDVNIDSARHAVRIDGAVTATINGGTIRGAIGTGTGTYHAVNVSGTANVTIEAGTFVGPKGTTADSGSAVNVQSGATVTIKGGNFFGGKNSTLASKGTLSITGGTYDQDPTAYVAAGYEATTSDNISYVVKKKAEVKVVTFANAGHNLRLQDLIKIGFYFTATPAEGKTATEVGAYIWADGTAESSAVKVVATYNSTTGKYTAEGNGIRAQELDTMYYAKYYAVIDGVEYTDVVDDYAATEYLEYVYTYYTTGNLQSTRSLVIDLANYAAMAQTYFALDSGTAIPEKLINDFMTDNDKTLNWSDDLKRANPTVNKSTSGGYTATWGGANVNLLDALSLSFIVNNTDVDGVIYWTQEDYDANTTLSYENKSGEGTTRQGMSGGKNSTFGTIPGLYSFNIYDNYYAVMYKNGSAGYLYSAVYGRSIASYASYWVDYYASATAEKDVALRELCKAMLIYGNNAETYFD